jgi:putative NADPH-quinone reductase
MLKGWVDRVFAMGQAYGAGRFYETEVFQGKRALLSLTTGSGSPVEAYRLGGLQGDLLGILRPIHRGMLQFTGFTVLAPHVVYGPAQQSVEERAAELAVWSARLLGLATEIPLEVGIY